MGIRPRYYWTVTDLMTGYVLDSRKLFCNIENAKESLKMCVGRLVAKGMDSEDFRFQIKKYSPRMGYTEMVCADSGGEEGESLPNRYREHMLKNLVVEGLNKEEEEKLIDLAKKIRGESVVSVFTD